MDMKIEKVTLKANGDMRLLDKNWTFEFDDTAYSHSDENWIVEAKDGAVFWTPTSLADDLAKVLMEEILKDDE